MAINNSMPGWLDEFLNNFAKTTKKETTAEINVQTLPKVVWNDSTFYVSLDEAARTADVMNEYGNIVTSIKNVGSVDDVNKHLTENQVVASLTEEDKMNTEKTVTLDTELEKFKSYLEAEAGEFDADNSTSTSTDSSSSTSTNTDSSNGQTEQSSADSQMDQAAQTTAEITSLKKTVASLETKMEKMAELIGTLQDNIHAYNDPGNVYDLSSSNAELNHVKETADATEKVINVEHATDLTVPAGRVSLKDKILTEIDTIMEEPTEVLTTEVEPTEIEETIDEKPVEETFVETVEEDIPEVEIVEDVPEVVVEEDIPEDSEKDSEKDSDEAPEVEIEEVVEDEKPEEIVKLSGKDEEIFKNGICPICGHKALALTNASGNIQGVVCNDCDAEFGVNLDTEDIYNKQ